MTKKIIQLFTLSLVLLPVYSFAQSDISITLEPKNPTPYSQVTLTVVSYAIDVNQSTITWTSKKKELLKGVGQKQLTVTTGGVGEQLPIHVSVSASTGESYGLDIVVAPQSVDLLYEAEENYVPLFYEGKALPAEESLVKFIAMPSISDGGNLLPPSSVSYFWYIDDNFIDNASGIGKQSAILPLNTLSNSTEIKVVAHSPKGVVAEKTLTLYPHGVMPLLYTYNEILGANHANLISRRFEAVRDFTVMLEPFFLSTNHSLGNSASYQWLLDGLPVTPLGGRLLALHPKENSYGSKNLSVSIANTKRRLQTGVVDVALIFDTRK